MLTYAHVCSRMLTYSAVAGAFGERREHLLRLQLMRDAETVLLDRSKTVQARMLTYADVCSTKRTYADVC